MARRKNTKFIDPRYFMDEKTDIIKESNEQGINEIFGAMKAIGRAVVPGGMTMDDEIKLQIKQYEAKAIKRRPDTPQAKIRSGHILRGMTSDEAAMLLSRTLSYDQILALVIAKEWEGPKGDSHINRIVDMMGIEVADTLKSAVDTLISYSDGVSFENFSPNVKKAYGHFKG